ncbi:MAG: ATP-binding protein [Thermoguttaceae bacterium]|jgi:signal transduction histidine kinase|nr:ATP-binding protein [Thermoguttaceae bacterium]
MRLSPEGARWFVRVRWLACAAVFLTVWFTSAVLGVVAHPLPLYLVAAGMVAYNLLFEWAQGRMLAGDLNVERSVFRQITCDLVALTLLLYFSDLARNPFLFFFVFHMIIASMYLHGLTPYLVGAMAVGMVGAVLLLEYAGWIPVFPLRYPTDAIPPTARALDGLYLAGLFVAFASTMWMAVYFTTSIHHYVDRAFAEFRQKEKMVGIGQLVAGIAHQIANPLDGVQNCLQRVGERVKDDPRLSEYIQMMAEALDRIERTAKRVQAFARPRGITLGPTDVNLAIEGTLQVLGTSHGSNIRVETELGDVSLVLGDHYTLQEVFFNLCTNALAAMPRGGTLTLRSYTFARSGEDAADCVAVDVSDTGVGIPRVEMEQIFEPFYTTRGESGGTGLGLGLCRMLINEMGGRMTVQSALGQGTTFTVILHPAGGNLDSGAVGA